ncbi:unnamed protein product [Echinostoma caproni]|uniref:Uncharacterized protein n=1 Tax=Echinostoma caproni TaxID=27848 RepID=A0A183A7Y1_9TREM|nr:unnamed protein product [Echinostoma caproni]
MEHATLGQTDYRGHSFATARTTTVPDLNAGSDDTNSDITSMLTTPRTRTNGGPFLRLPRAILNAQTLGDLEEINTQGVGELDLFTVYLR